jgi:hypothetical protein
MYLPNLVRIVLAILFAAVLSQTASAHCVVGSRFFPATIIADDPCVNDELAFPTIAEFDNGDQPSAQELDISGEYDKTITENFGVSIGGDWVHLDVPGDGSHAGFNDLDEIATYEARHPIGTQARLALALALYTGQRSSDVIRMGPQHVRNGWITVRQQKTGARLEIRLHADLHTILNATPCEHLTFLVAKNSKPFSSANSFAHRVQVWTQEAGLRGCSLHGPRKACCRRLAEAGCSASQIMAITGHKTLAEVERYVRAAEQKRMADEAIQRTENYPRSENHYPRAKKAK